MYWPARNWKLILAASCMRSRATSSAGRSMLITRVGILTMGNSPAPGTLRASTWQSVSGGRSRSGCSQPLLLRPTGLWPGGCRAGHGLPAACSCRSRRRRPCSHRAGPRLADGGRKQGVSSASTLYWRPAGWTVIWWLMSRAKWIRPGRGRRPWHSPQALPLRLLIIGCGDVGRVCCACWPAAAASMR